VFGWDPATWVGIALTIAFGVAGIVLAIWFWIRPRSPTANRPAKHEQLRMDVSNEFPIFDQPDGSRTVGDHLVGVTVRNGTARPVRVIGWGIGLPADRSIAVQAPTTTWEPRLPYWLQAGDAATWYVDAAELRRQSAALSVPFDHMVAFACFADGRRISADRGVPLA
jgi:hypothetical protein